MENILFYIILIVTGVAVILSFIFAKSKALKKLAYDLVVFAEKNIKGSKLGEEKLDFVIKELREYFPHFSTFITEAMLRKIIEAAVDRMKKELSKEDVTEE